jgi:nucleotide-binding universal stress UspA family protein
MLEKVLIPLDGSSLAECVLPHAIHLARAFSAHVTLLQVLELNKTSTQFVDPLNWYFRKAESETYLNEQSHYLQQFGVPVDHELLEGAAAARIIDYADIHESDLLLLSSHGKTGLSEWGISSIAQKIIWRANTSVMLVRAHQPRQGDQMIASYQRILVPLDGSQRAECGLPLATLLARDSHAKLILAHVVARPNLFSRLPAAEDTKLVNQLVERNLEEATTYLEQLHARLPVENETHLLISDNVIHTLHNLVEQQEIDLVSLSAHGYSSSTQQLYGSLVSNFIFYGSTPLLIKQDLKRHQIALTRPELAMAQDSSSVRRMPIAGPPGS